MKILNDNQGATFVANNPIYHTKLRRHVAMDLHFVWEKTDKGEVKVEHIPRIKQMVDILTKALNPKLFLDLRLKLVNSIKPPLRV